MVWASIAYFTEKHNTKTESNDALVKITLRVQLQRRLPGNWKWELEEINEKLFATTFPSEAHLQSMCLWGTAAA